MTGAPMSGYDLDELPTGTAVRVLLGLVREQQQQINSVSREVGEIKTLVRTSILTGKVLGGLIPIVAAATTGLIWAIRNLK